MDDNLDIIEMETGEKAPFEDVVLTVVFTDHIKRADPSFDSFWDELVIEQDAYFASNGKYFQLLEDSGIPHNGYEKNFTKRIPSDETHIEDVNFSFSSKIPYQVAIHERVGNEGNGYKMIATFTLADGKIYQRTRDSDLSDTGWNEVITEE